MDSQQYVSRQRPVFFVERIGAAQPTLVQPVADVVEMPQVQAHWALRDVVTRKLTQHIRFANDFYTEHYHENDQKQYYAYRQPIANPEFLETFIRHQLRAPFSLLSAFPKEELSNQVFTELWQWLHSLMSKAECLIEHVFLAHAADDPRDIVLRENREYMQYGNFLSSQLVSIPHGVHRVFIICRTKSPFSDQALHSALILDIGQGLDDMKLVKANLLPLLVSKRLRLKHKLAVDFSHFDFAAERRLHDAEGGQLFIVWKKISYRFWRFRHRLLRHIDQILFTYSCMMNNAGAQDSQSCLAELLLLSRLEHAIALWLKERQYISSRTNAVWNLYHWVQQRFYQRAQYFLTQSYYDPQAMSLSGDTALFVQACAQFVELEGRIS